MSAGGVSISSGVCGTPVQCSQPRLSNLFGGSGLSGLAQNINLNLSFGKVRLRPYGEGRGKVAVSGGTYGQELFIVEKVSDGRPFTLHTTREDCAAYYKRQRGAYSTICLLWLAGAALLAAQSSWGGAAVLGLLGGVFALGWVNCQRRLGRIKRKGMLME